MDNSEKYMFDENVDTKELNKDKILERGQFVANGYTFTIKPIYLGEEDDYLGDLSFSPIPILDDEEELSDKEKKKKINSYIITLFSERMFTALGKEAPRLTFWQKLLKRFSKRYYYLGNNAYPIAKWLQKKVYYKHRHVVFYDLERKFNISKEDIQKMVIYLHELSGF